MLSVLRRSGRTHAKRALRGFGSTAADVIRVDNPYTGEIFCEVPMQNKDDVSNAVSMARMAHMEWRETSLQDRLDLCERFLEAMESMRDQIADEVSGMMGKPRHQAYGEFGGVVERTHGMMALAPEALADEILDVKNGCERIITREPVGVVLVIAPWNFPLLTAINTIVPAILSGNAVVLKHSERTPLCGGHFQEAFEKAGAPKGLVTAVNCPHDVTAAMINDRRVNFVSFTGSVRGGHEVYRTIAENRFINTTLELGGKDPAYVASDIDAAEAAAGLVDGAMFNAGQSCCGIERVYVHRSQYDKFLEAAKELCDAYVLGDPTSTETHNGPQALASSVPFLEGQVKDALAKGARLLSGSAEGVQDATGRGRFFAPTLLADCSHDMDVMVEESFGPILPVTPVDSDEEAVALMNDSNYGLTSAIFTKDQDRVRRMGKAISTGTVFMNRCDYLDPDLPWTAGGENTGKGVSLSRHGFDGVTRMKGYNMRV